MSGRRLLVIAAALGLAATLSLPPGAAGAPASPAHAGAHGRFPTTLALPDGFQPEGIAIGALPYAYLGSLSDGAIYRANLVTGRGETLSPGPGTQSVGLALDRRGRLFVAGGAASDARVVSVASGAVLASYQLAGEGSFVNDVALTPDAAWFTDSFQPVLYRLPLGRHGALPPAGAPVTVPLTGDFVQGEGFNANGISTTPDGTGLLVAQSNTGQLFRVDPASGVASRVDLGDEALPGADGLLRRGRLLYVVHSAQVAVVRLDRTGTSGTVLTRVTDPRFETPTTVAAFGGRLYLPDARFTTEPTPTTAYAVWAIPVPRP